MICAFDTTSLTKIVTLRYAQLAPGHFVEALAKLARYSERFNGGVTAPLGTNCSVHDNQLSFLGCWSRRRESNPHGE